MKCLLPFSIPILENIVVIDNFDLNIFPFYIDFEIFKFLALLFEFSKIHSSDWVIFFCEQHVTRYKDFDINCSSTL